MTPRRELLATIAKQGFDSDEGGVAGEAWIDDAIGAVLDKLRQLGIDRNTFVVFAPDHGSNAKASLFSRDGTRIPMIAWWPGRVPGGLVCDQLVQNIDWVPTAFDLAGMTPPAEYRMDGRSLVPLLANGTADDWRDHLYFELGYARAVVNKDWKYIAVRYPEEAIGTIQGASPDRLPRLMSYIGRMGIGTRGASHSGFWDADQLYNLQADPEEQTNLASNPQNAEQLRHLRELLTAHIRSVGRPFGEFLPGGNAAPPGAVDTQIARVKQLEIQGKEVIIPGDESPDAPKASPAKPKKKPRTREKIRR